MKFFAYLAIVVKNIILGLSIFFTAKLTESTDVFDVLALRFIMSFVVLWLLKMLGILKVTVGIRDFFGKGKHSHNIKYVIIAAIVDPVIYMIVETFGISMTTGITAGTILAIGPVFHCIAESVILKEKSTAMQKIFLGLGIIGVLYIAFNTNTSDGENSVLGILLMFAAVLAGALYFAFSRKASKDFSSVDITYVYCMFGMIAFNVINIIRRLFIGGITDYFVPYMNIDNLIGFAFLAIGSSVIAMGLTNYALSKVQITTFTAFGGLSTIVTVFAGVFLANETVYTYHYIGFALILARMIGVSYISIKKDREKLKIQQGKV